jgi:hypothetical protein
MIRELFPSATGILLDTNLLVVLIIGQVQQLLFGRSPVSEFSISDFDLLVATLSTPYILAETSAHFTKTGANARRDCRAALSAYIPLMQTRYSTPEMLAQNQLFGQFGITDVSIFEAADDRTFVLTTDGALVGMLNAKGIPCLKYSDYRSIAANY